jgi:hypothetical protein
MQKNPRKQVGEYDANRAGQQTKNAELHAKDAHNSHSRCAQSFEHNRFPHAAEARAGDARS